MDVLIIGGSGLISTGIAKHLKSRGARITLLNRGRRGHSHGDSVHNIVADRNDFDSFEKAAGARTYDAVIDMICFNTRHAESAVRAFGNRCGHFIFCSTVCTYGVKAPPRVLIDETFPQEPISDYGRDKLNCERVFLRAHEERKFPVTIVRPSHTYGPGNPLIDNLEFDPVAWDRIERGLPILCSGDGLGLWVSTHRDDCGKFFAHAAMNPRTFGNSYNATRDQIVTWRDLIRQTAGAIGQSAQVLFMPAQWIVAHDPARFALLREITQFHGAYDSSRAKRDVPEFQCEVDYRDGAAEALNDLRARGAWKSGAGDALYESMVDKALKAGVVPVDV